MQIARALLLPLVLLLLLGASFVNSCAVRKDSGDGNARTEPSEPVSGGCSVGRRDTAVTALNELFTCLLTRHVSPTEIYKRAFTIDFGGIAGSGVTQPPLLPALYSVRALKSDSVESFRKFFDVVPAFTVELGQNETRGAQQLALIEAFERHLETSVHFADTFQTLKANGLLSGVASVADFVRGVVRDAWFKLYGRSSKSHAAGLRESSGFGHVMVGETRGTSVTGFHSWLQLLAGEEAGEFLNKGHFRVRRDSFVTATLQFSWLGKFKSISGFVFGIPPDFEMALLTASFVANPGRKTQFTVNGSPVAVQTYTVNHQPESIGSAYFVL